MDTPADSAVPEVGPPEPKVAGAGEAWDPAASVADALAAVAAAVASVAAVFAVDFGHHIPVRMKRRPENQQAWSIPYVSFYPDK